MQYTNFLRDIHEDRTKYGRIYIPEKELNTYGLKQSDLLIYCKNNKYTGEQWKLFMKKQIQTTRQLYIQANTTIPYLDKDAQMPVLMASHMYEAILDGIESKKYNIFNGSNKTSLRKKTKVFIHTLRKNIPVRHRAIWITISSLF